MGFDLLSNEDLEITYVGPISIRFLTERYYHPSLSVSFTDSKGVKRELGLLEQVVVPSIADQHRTALLNYSLDHEFKRTDISILTANGSFREYIELTVDQTLDFLQILQAKNFHLSQREETDYSERERLSLRRFGIY